MRAAVWWVESRVTSSTGNARVAPSGSRFYRFGAEAYTSSTVIEMLEMAGTRSILAEAIPQVGLLRLLLVVVIAGASILLLSAALLALMRIHRRRWNRIRTSGEGRVRSETEDAWNEAGRRVPYEPDAPHERNPDDDLPSFGGRKP